MTVVTGQVPADPARPAPAGPAPAGPVTRPPDGVGHPKRWWILAVLGAVAFMAQLELFIVNVALPTIGHSLGGASLSGLSWILNAYAVVFAALLVPAVLLAAVTLLILGTVQGPVWGWTDPRTLGLLAAALVATVLTVARTIQHPHALIEKTLFGSRDFTFASLALLLYFVAFALFLLTTVLFLQGQWHYSPVRAGLAITPGPAMAALFGVNAGRISSRFGRTLPAAVGAGLVAVSAAYWIIAAPAHPAARY